MSKKNSMATQTAPPQDNQRNASREDADDYDPYSHRDLRAGTSNFTAFAHMLKGIIGTGIFATPKAFSRTGYVAGILMGLCIGLLLTYCIHQLVRCQYALCKRHRKPVLTYQESFKLALEDGPKSLRCFSPYAIPTINTLIAVNQLGTCAIYVIFSAQNMRKASDWNVNDRFVILTLLLPFLLLLSIRNLKYLAPFSTIGNIITIVGIIIILVYVFQDIPPIEDIEAGVSKIVAIPLFFGTYLFALTATGVVASLENKMRTPKSFCSRFGVVNSSIFISTILYVCFGFFGYWKYGDTIQDSITLNLPQDTGAKVIQSIFAISVFVSIGINFFVAFEIIWNVTSKYFKRKLHGEFFVRLVLGLFIFALAISTQELGTFISLMGALCLSLLSLSFPALMAICVRYPDFGRYNHVLISNIIIIILGIVGLITGVTTSVMDIANKYS